MKKTRILKKDSILVLYLTITTIKYVLIGKMVHLNDIIIDYFIIYLGINILIDIYNDIKRKG